MPGERVTTTTHLLVTLGLAGPGGHSVPLRKRQTSHIWGSQRRLPTVNLVVVNHGVQPLEMGGCLHAELI